jgi:hypothetical protein
MRHADRVKLLCGIAVVAAIAMSAVPSFAQTNPDPNSAPNPYRLDEGWAKQPMGRGFGSTIGLNVDRDGKSMVSRICGQRLAPVVFPVRDTERVR